MTASSSPIKPRMRSKPPLSAFQSRGALLFVIIVHHEARVDNPRYPTKYRENETEKETRQAPGHQHSHWRQNDAEKITQCFHWLRKNLSHRLTQIFSQMFYPRNTRIDTKGFRADAPLRVSDGARRSRTFFRDPKSVVCESVFIGGWN
jgi:hypothetical protein